MKIILLIARTAFWFVRWLTIFGLFIWGGMFFAYGPLSSYRYWMLAVYCLAVLSVFVFRHSQTAKAAAVAAVLSALLCFFTLQPSNNRDWELDNTVIPWAEISGDLITVHNIRSFTYRSETDYDVNYYDRTFDLSKLSTVDLFISFWGLSAIAHTIVSFGFSDGSYLAFSVETRKQKGQGYSAIAGFFRNYELLYVAADEQDVIGLRAKYRGESVFLYRLTTPIPKARKVFLDYISEMNGLRNKPAFYNALTDNCTTNILMHFRASPPYPSYSLGILLPGYLDKQLYESQRALIHKDEAFTDFKKQANISDKAKAAKLDNSFSEKIRAN